MFRFTRPSDAELVELAAAQQDRALTYPEVGASADEVLPVGYQHDRVSVSLGDGRDVFDRSVTALREWEPQRGSGFSVGTTGPIQPGTLGALAAPLPGVFVVATFRIVYVEDERDRFAFAYGTLPFHAEQGEERFEVHIEGAAVSFGIVAFSKPRYPIARLGSPVTRYFQRRATAGYMHAMQAASHVDVPPT